MIEWGRVGLRVLPLHICEKASRGQVAGGSGKAGRGGAGGRGGRARLGVGWVGWGVCGSRRVRVGLSERG